MLRPTLPSIFGRSVINKNAFKSNKFLTCETIFSTTCIGLKLNVVGFPYSSQDGETITCAETSLWSVMEYFSNRYAEYFPTLPSKIIDTLKGISLERQTPSKGLDYTDLSFALKTFGFGTRIYANENEAFKSEVLNLLACYVESGIPIIVAIKNNRNIGHAYVCVGREKFDNIDLSIADVKGKLEEFLDFDEIPRQFIFIDDNFPPYQKASLSEPAGYCILKDWKDCRISHFIVPLYPKIYLEAFEAKRYCTLFLNEMRLFSIPDYPDEKVVSRIFLTSSRSYKDETIRDNDLGNEIKQHIISTPMPKFIWVCEISTLRLFSEGYCLGSIVLDATEPKIDNHKPLLYMHMSDFIIRSKKASLYLIKLSSKTKTYSVYKNNLSGF